MLHVAHPTHKVNSHSITIIITVITHFQRSPKATPTPLLLQIGFASRSEPITYHHQHQRLALSKKSSNGNACMHHHFSKLVPFWWRCELVTRHQHQHHQRSRGAATPTRRLLQTGSASLTQRPCHTMSSPSPSEFPPRGHTKTTLTPSLLQTSCTSRKWTGHRM